MIKGVRLLEVGMEKKKVRANRLGYMLEGFLVEGRTEG